MSFWIGCLVALGGLIAPIIALGWSEDGPDDDLLGKCRALAAPAVATAVGACFSHDVAVIIFVFSWLAVAMVACTSRGLAIVGFVLLLLLTYVVKPTGLAIVGVVLDAAVFLVAVFRPSGHAQIVIGGEGEATSIDVVTPKRTLDDLVGMDDLKGRLLSAGKEIVNGAGEHRNGILLHGEPGNGKTEFARALAGSLKLPIVEVPIGRITSKWIGEGIERLQSFMDQVKSHAPCVFFIDEVDSFLTDRDLGGDQGAVGQEHQKMVNLFLTELVNFRRTNIVVIAATNFLERLDGAAIREGRFDFKMEVPNPDKNAREFILRSTIATEAKRKRASVAIDASGVERAAARWEGYSASRMAAVAVEATHTAIQSGNKSIGFDALMAALRTIQGQKGRLPEDTPTLEKLSLSVAQRQILGSLAVRLENIEKIEQMGGSVPAGLLFHGPAGTGKTLLAKSLAKTVDWNFIAVAGNDLLRNEAAIEDLVAQSREIRPCIVFIDEADDILADRTGAAAMMAGSRSATNKLLTAMDGAGSKVRDALWIAATNHPDDLDPAALRAGRFTEKVEFGLPDEDVITKMVREWIGGSKATFSAEVTPEAVAQMFKRVQVNAADVGAILQHAVNTVITQNLITSASRPVTLGDVNQAVGVVKMPTRRMDWAGRHG
jgi:transitional endoplasmic reticulum ATPase